jgi:hypothetical protein
MVNRPGKPGLEHRRHKQGNDIMTASVLLPARSIPSPMAVLRSVLRGLASHPLRAYLASRRAAAARMARYTRVRDEIARMPPHIAMDLGICAGDADELAARVLDLR